MTLIYLTVAWLAGIAIASSLVLPWWVWLIWAALPAAAFIRIPAQWRAGFGCMVLLALGGLRMTVAQSTASAHDITEHNGSGFVIVEGVIIDAPDVRDSRVDLRVRVKGVVLEDNREEVATGVVLVQAPNVATYRYGDPVRVQGQLVAPPSGADDFSYRQYLARDGIGSMMQYSQVEVTGARQGNPVRRVLLDFRAYAHQVVKRMLPDPQASLLAGILLGIETGISPDVKEAFNTVGATHVIVISGSNMVIMAGLFWAVSKRFLKDNASAVVTIAGIAIYTMFVGGDASVTRAAVMVTLGLIAARLGRQTYGLASLSFAALLLTLIDPDTLWDVGFQLSYLSTLGLILYVEPIQKLIARGLEKLFAAETAQKIAGATSDMFTVTIAAQIATTPIIAYHFGRFSLVSLPVNLLIVPVQTPLMVLGGLGTLVAMIVPPPGQLLLWGSWLFLSWTIGVVRFFAALPFASVSTGEISPAAVFAIYIVLFGGTWIAMQPATDKKRWGDSLGRAFSVKALGSAGLLSAMLLFSAAFSLPDQRLHVTFIDVGEGNATLIETPGGRHILIDAGGSGRRLSTALGDEIPFWDRRIDLVVLTQPTPAHSGGLATVLDRYDIGAVMTNGRHGTTELSGTLWQQLEAKQIPEVIALPGMRINIGDGVTLTVLQSDLNTAEADEPGDPVVILLTYGEMRLLFTGDLSEDAENVLLQSELLADVTVLQVTRGGHRDGSSEPFLDTASPQISIIAPTTNDLPHAETVARLDEAGSRIYRVDTMGTIRVVSDGKRMWIQTGK